MGNEVANKRDLEGVSVIANLIITVVLVAIRLIAPTGVIAWDIVTIVLAAASLFFSQVIIRKNAANEANKTSRYLAIGMSAFAGLMIVLSVAFMI